MAKLEAMDDFRQSVHFTSSFDGWRLAYAICGRGHPLVRVPTWISHVEHDWQSLVMRHLVIEMASRHKLVNYDCRGVGMSERKVADMSFDAWVRDPRIQRPGVRRSRSRKRHCRSITKLWIWPSANSSPALQSVEFAEAVDSGEARRGVGRQPQPAAGSRGGKIGRSSSFRRTN
jgi:hypothetical protein